MMVECRNAGPVTAQHARCQLPYGCADTLVVWRIRANEHLAGASRVDSPQAASQVEAFLDEEKVAVDRLLECPQPLHSRTNRLIEMPLISRPALTRSSKSSTETSGISSLLASESAAN